MGSCKRSRVFFELWKCWVRFWHWNPPRNFQGETAFFQDGNWKILICLVVWSLEHFIVSMYIGNVMIPTVTHSIIFQRGRLKPPTSYKLPGGSFINGRFVPGNWNGKFFQFQSLSHSCHRHVNSQYKVRPSRYKLLIVAFKFVLIYKPINTGWWFGTCFFFHSTWDNSSHWLSYLSEGLKPPTSKI